MYITQGFAQISVSTLISMILYTSWQSPVLIPCKLSPITVETQVH